jgi:hypothetical protein
MGEQMFTMKSEVIGYLWWVSDLVQRVNQNIYERRHFTISELSCEFPQNPLTALYKIITGRLGCHHKFYARRVSKNVHGRVKSERMALALPFLEQYHKDSDEFLSHNCNSWWNLGFICEGWNQRVVKAVDAHTFTKQAEHV